MKKAFTIFIVYLTAALHGPLLFGQTINRVDPPFWWSGMKNTAVQLMLHGEQLSEAEVSLKSGNVKITGTQKVESKNYLLIDLDLTGVAPGANQFELKVGKKKIPFTWNVLARDPQTTAMHGLSGADVMYLIMPDRFANGDPSNDNAQGMLEKADRTKLGGKHGGDLKGIIQNLDYIADLGVTTIWLNPVYENNMPEYSYHGYSITDHYRVDPRYGTMDEYKRLVNEAHKRGLKVVKDMIFNHIGYNHFWMKDLPSQDWLNQWSEYTQTNYVGAVVTDPYASKHDYDRMVKGWFVPSMPDLNQNNKILMTYLIQQSIWWIEHTGIDGIRMDTYPYPFREPMADWVKAVSTEYPDFYLVGETWLHTPAHEAYWQNRPATFQNADGYSSGLASVSDFPLHYAMLNAIKNGNAWALYETLAQDFVYPNPYMNKIFIDNHDVDRFFHQIDRDKEKLKMALALLFTTRGIPQVFYGTELLMQGSGDHGNLRQDFPGGWLGDARSAFTREGRTTDENEIFDYMKKLLDWRKSRKEIFAHGKLVHFIPENDVYVYSRGVQPNNVIVIINNSAETRTVRWHKYLELAAKRGWRDVISGKEYFTSQDIKVAGKSVLVLE
jgi:neopullulanase